MILEYSKLLVRRWSILVTGPLSALVTYVLAIYSGLVFPAWLWALFIAAPASVAQFLVWREVRLRVQPELVVRGCESRFRGDPKFHLYDNGAVTLHVPLCLELINNGGNATIHIMSVRWVTTTLLGRERLVADAPLHSIGPGVAFGIPVRVAAAATLQKADYLFEYSHTYDEDQRRQLPRKGRLLLHLDIAGQPDVDVLLAKYSGSKKWWRSPDQGMVKTITPDVLLT